MEERINILKDKARNLNDILSEKEKDLIYFNSIYNFLLYLDKFEDALEQRKVTEVIEEYFLQIDENLFSFSPSQKMEILRKYINPITYYYQLRFRFKLLINLKYSIFIGLNIDVVLWIFGFLKHVYYIPIATVILFSYWAYVKIYFVSKNKFY
jgi:hypothetical protein